MTSVETPRRAPEPEPGREHGLGAQLRERILSGSVLVTVLSIVLALLIGAVLIAISDPAVRDAIGYFFAAPMDTINAIWTSVSNAYWALFTGSILNPGGDNLGDVFAPLSETVLTATPLIACGLGVALAFRAGLFNIGAEGQLVIGALLAGYVGFAWDLPPVVHMLVAVIAGMIGGAIWAGIAGFLKARTGAHEVITTIMLNYVSRFLLAYLLTVAAFHRPGRSDPISPIVDPSAQMSTPLEGLRVHTGILFALAAAVFMWWLLERSTLGFQFRAVGANQQAARSAGISVERSFTVVMLIAGAFAGIAGASQVLGTEKTLTGGIGAGIGFDAITVALLGRAKPLGTVLAGLLFGALRAGGLNMQAKTGTPIDIVVVVQSLIVLFIAAPPLVRAVFRVPARGGGMGQISKGWNG
ncbi:MAG TPA: ABC transporter permease [Thermopolyspora sp.]